MDATAGSTEEERPWGLGIEEEYLLFDAAGHGLRNDSETVRAVVAARSGDDVDPELLQSQVEVATAVHHDIDDAAAELRRLRHAVGAAALEAGCRLAAAGCHPSARWRDQEVTDKDRYHHLLEVGGQVASETMICGLHVHVGIPDPDDRIRAANAARRWLGPLLALSASSPFWEGRDTGFASFRTPVFRRWANTGVPGTFSDFDDFSRLVDDLVAAGSIDDGTNLYWDIRPSVRFPTVEVRVADACPRLDDTLVIAALVRAVLRSAIDPGTRPPAAGSAATPRVEVLEAAVRHAARVGLGETLVHPGTGRLAPAADVVAALVEWCRPALEAFDDLTLVEHGVTRILGTGGASGRLRAAYARSGDLDDVAALLVAETADLR